MVIVNSFRDLSNEIFKCVYIMEFQNYVKIGYSKNIALRALHLYSVNKHMYRIAYLKCDNNNVIEKEMHNFFSEKRIKGEYFNVDFNSAVKELDNQKPKVQFKNEILYLCEKLINHVEYHKKVNNIPECHLLNEFGVGNGNYFEIKRLREFSFKIQYVEKLKSLRFKG